MSALPAVVDLPPADVATLSLREAWDLEDRCAEVASLLSERIDDEIRRLASEGWTQARIAEECGRDQSSVSRRMQRLGIEPASNRGRPRIMQPHNSFEQLDEAEVVDGEVMPPALGFAPEVEEEPELHAPSKPITRVIDGVRFPRGGISDESDIRAYTTVDLKRIAKDLLRRATQQEAAALGRLFNKYALEAEGKGQDA